MPIPADLKEISYTDFTFDMDYTESIIIDESLPSLLYNYYNLDPNWYAESNVNRILILEPSVFKKYPVSKKNIDFAIKLAKANIPSIQIFIGEFDSLKANHAIRNFIYKEHPLNNYEGTEEARDWMFSIEGYFPSFFSFWKKCRKERSRFKNQV